jgi:hypothetical protein
MRWMKACSIGWEDIDLKNSNMRKSLRRRLMHGGEDLETSQGAQLPSEAYTRSFVAL